MAQTAPGFVFLTVLEAELSKIKVLADLVPDEILSLVCGWVPFCHNLTRGGERSSLCASYITAPISS